MLAVGRPNSFEAGEAPQSVFRWKRLLVRKILAGGVAMLLVGLGMLSGPVLAVLDQFSLSPWGSPSADMIGLVAIFVILLPTALFFIYGGVRLCREAWPFAWVTLRVEENGLTIERLRKRNTVAWEEIVSVQILAGRFVQNDLTYTLTLSNGATRSFGPLIEDIEKLGQIIEERIIDRLGPRELARLHAGEELDFGPIRLGQSGLTHGGQTVALPEIARATIEGNKELVLYKCNDWTEWLRIKVAHIPNIALLLHLIEVLSGPGAELATIATRPRELESKESALWEKNGGLSRDEIEGFGAPLRTLGQSQHRIQEIRIAFYACWCAIGLVLLRFLVDSLDSSVITHTRFLSLSMAISLVVALLLIAGVLYLILMRRDIPRLLLYRQGLVRLEGSKLYACSWRRIDSILETIHGPKNAPDDARWLHYRHAIQRDDGRWFHFGTFFVSADQVWDFILGAVYERIFDHMVLEYHAGGKLYFGEISVTRNSFRFGLLRRGWTKFDSYDIQGAKLRLFWQDQILPVAVVPLTHIVNLRMLLHLLQVIQNKDTPRFDVLSNSVSSFVSDQIATNVPK